METQPVRAPGTDEMYVLKRRARFHGGAVSHILIRKEGARSYIWEREDRVRRSGAPEHLEALMPRDAIWTVLHVLKNTLPWANVYFLDVAAAEAPERCLAEGTFVKILDARDRRGITAEFLVMKVTDLNEFVKI